MDTLPVDLVIEIMGRMETPRDLFAFIQTSTWILQCFYGRRVTVLKSVIRNVFPVGILVDAVTACEAFKLGQLRWTEGTSVSFYRDQKTFIERYSMRRASGVAELGDMGLLNSLCKLWWIVEYFSMQFCNQAREDAQKDMPRARPSNITLSSTEIIRTIRALLRFEIYRRVFCNTIESPTEENHAREVLGGQHFQRSIDEGTKRRLLTDYLFLFPNWEREEILSIYEYLLRCVEEMYGRIYEYVVDTIDDAASETSNDAASETSNDAASEMSNDAISEIYNEARKGSSGGHLAIYEMLNSCKDLGSWNDGRETSDTLFECIVMRGLPFLRWVSNLSKNDHTSALLDFAYWQYRPSLSDLMASKQGWEKWPEYRGPPEWPDDTHTWMPNKGWIWAVVQSMGDEEDIESRAILRKAGFCFWDEQRVYDELGLDHITPLPDYYPQSPSSTSTTLPNHWTKILWIIKQYRETGSPKGLKGLGYLDRACEELATSAKMNEATKDGKLPLPFSKAEAMHFGFEY